MTAKELFLKMRIESKKGYAYHIGYIGKRKYNMLVNMVEQFKKNADIDFDIGVINFGQYQNDISRYNLMVKSLGTAEIY